MMVVLEAVIILLAIACFVGAIYFFTKDKKKEESVEYQPPVAPPGYTGPELHIRTHGIAIFWTEIGQPRRVGTQVEVNMKSGRTAIYELKNVRPAQDVDWSWYDLEFVRYKDEPNGDTPASPTTK